MRRRPLRLHGIHDCAASDAGNVCCLENITPPDGSTCPYELTGEKTTTTACVTGGACTAQSTTNVRMCKSNSDCTAGQHCEVATLSLDPNALFGACL